jgi:two-component system CitB family sensor kinase
VLTVADSGPGVPAGTDVFSAATRRAAHPDAEHPDTVHPDAVHGRGIGLPLVRDIAARRGGEVWLVDPGGHDGSGAVFCARLPGVLRPPAPPSQGDAR